MSLKPIDELQELEWSVSSLVYLTDAGSHQREIMENATRGIVTRLEWIREQLEAAGEGRRNLYNAATGKIEPDFPPKEEK
jgi:hypothetical protein